MSRARPGTSPPRRRSALAACALLAALLAPEARAQEPRSVPDAPPPPDSAPAPDFGRGGVYGSLAMAYSVDNFTTGDFGSTFDDALGFDGRAGYRAGPRLAGEFELELQSFGFRQAGAGGVQVNNDVDTMVWTANLKGFLLPRRFQPYLLLGGGVLVVDVKSFGKDQNDVSGALRMGGGFDVHLTEAFALVSSASYVLPFGSVSDYEYYTFTVGIQYTLRLLH